MSPFFKHLKFALGCFLALPAAGAVSSNEPCPVSAGKDQIAETGPQHWWFGDRHLAVTLPAEGAVWPSNKIRPWSGRVFFWSEKYDQGSAKELEVSVRGSDGMASEVWIRGPTDATRNKDGGPVRAMLIDFGGPPGCYEVTGKYRGATLVFHLALE